MTYDARTHGFKGSSLDSEFPSREELEGDKYGKLVLRMCNAMKLKLIACKKSDGVVEFSVETRANHVAANTNLKSLYGHLVLEEDFKVDTPGIFKNPRDVVKHNPFFMKDLEEVEMLLDVMGV